MNLLKINELLNHYRQSVDDGYFEIRSDSIFKTAGSATVYQGSAHTEFNANVSASVFHLVYLQSPQDFFATNLPDMLSSQNPQRLKCFERIARSYEGIPPGTVFARNILVQSFTLQPQIFKVDDQNKL